MFLDKPPPAETEASIRRGSQVAGPTRLYNKVLRGPLPRTACNSIRRSSQVLLRTLDTCALLRPPGCTVDSLALQCLRKHYKKKSGTAL